MRSIGNLKNVWVIAQAADQKLKTITLELLGEGRRLANQLGEELCAVLVGYRCREAAQSLFDYGADRVLYVKHPQLEHYHPENYEKILAEVLGAEGPRIILAGATLTGREYISGLTARLQGGLLKDCSGLALDLPDQKLMANTPSYDGKQVSRYKLKKEGIQVAALRQGTAVPAIYKKRDSGQKIWILCPGNCFSDTRLKRISLKRGEGNGRLEEAKTVLAGGRGVGEDGFLLLTQLAKQMGGVAGCTRPCVDAGWADFKQQIGQTGVTVKPELYVAFGISGAVQHVAGMKDSGCIIGVNTDPQAEIFRCCDYGIKADAKRLIQALLEECRQKT